MIDEEKPAAVAIRTDEAGEDYYEETVVEYVDNRRQRRVLAIILILLILLLVGVGYFVVRLTAPVGAPSRADLPTGIEWVRSLYSFGPGADQLLVAPTAVDFAPNGTVWTLANHMNIVGFTPAGEVEAVIPLQLGMEPGQATSLEGLAVGDDGAIYVADYGSNAISVFSQEGEFLRRWGVELPLAIDVRGDVVAVAAANGIGLFDTQGELIAKWASRGAGDDQVDLPHGIRIGDEGTVYVSDTQNRRVKAYDGNGRVLWSIADSNKTGENLMSTDTTVPVVNGVAQQLLLPTGLAIDGNGRLLLTDTFTFEVVVLDPDSGGQIIGRYGEQGAQDGQFTYPTGVAYDADRDTLAVADTTNNRVQIIRIPNTGGNASRRALKGLTDTPVWLCCIPLFLLLVAAILWYRGRRKSDDADPAAESHRARGGDDARH